MNQPMLWVSVSILGYVVGSHAAWWFLDPWESVRPRAERGLLWETAPSWLAILHALYLGGIPLLAIALRSFGSARTWGFGRSLETRDVLLAIASGALVAATLRWQAHHLSADPSRSAVLSRPTAGELGWLMLRGFAQELHWAFYRAACLSIGLPSQTGAVYTSLCLLAFEEWANPWTRQDWRMPDGPWRMSQQAAAAVLSATVFLCTGSTPLCLLAHFVVLGAVVSGPRPALRLPGEAMSRAGTFR